LENLLSFPPHDNMMRDQIKTKKLKEMMERPEQLAKLSREMFKDFVPHVSIEITGEKVNLDAEMQTLASFIQLEADPIRRQALIEMAMKKKGIDVSGLPKAPPQALAPMQTGQGQPNPNAGQGVPPAQKAMQRTRGAMSTAAQK